MSVMVLYDYDVNTILTNPLKGQKTQELVRSQTRLIQYLLYQGLKNMALLIDNKCPEALQRFSEQTALISRSSHQTTTVQINLRRD